VSSDIALTALWPKPFAQEGKKTKQRCPAYGQITAGYLSTHSGTSFGSGSEGETINK
jgi:hypothetical protein